MFTFSDEGRKSDSYLTMNFPDSAAHFEDWDPTRQMNKGYEQSKRECSGSNILQTSDYIMLPITQSGHLLPPNTSITIQMRRAPNGLVLCSPTAENKNYKLVIDEIKLEIVRVRIKDPLVSRIYETWRRESCLSYYYNRVVGTGPYEIRRDTRVVDESMSISQMPMGVMAVFISSASASGRFDKNIFKFYQ